MCWVEVGQGELVWLGRGLTVLFVAAGCVLAPQLDDPKFGGVFQFIQQFQGYIWPGVVAAFLHAFLMPRAPAAAGSVALVLGPVLYGVFQFTAKTEGRPWGHEIHFLLQVLLTFLSVSLVMGAMAWFRSLPQPRSLPEREGVALRTEPVVYWAGSGVVAAVVVFLLVFW